MAAVLSFLPIDAPPRSAGALSVDDGVGASEVAAPLADRQWF
jgi:hypothetical protein